MSQEIINYGAAANDGQGDPLRVAFIKTDNNFDQIWAAGPVGSNITILNNTIQVTNTNGNLELATNGTGVISTRNHVRPSLSQVYDLGSANLRYRTGYFSGLNIDGNVTITGNLSAGNISYTGNVFVGDLQGSVFADDSTIMVDAIDNVLRADAIYTNNYYYANGSPFGTDTGNIGFDNNNIYNTNGQGVVISNFSFIAEAETAYVQIPAGNSSGDLSIVQEQGNVRIAANSAAWTFGTDNKLTAPGEVYAQYFSIRGGNPSGTIGALGYGGDDVALDATGNITLNTAGAEGGPQWKFDNAGQLTTPDGTLIGNIEGANTFGFYNSNANTEFLLETPGNSWSFNSATGNLSLPPSGNIVGVTANNSGRIQWLGNSSGDGAGYTTLGLIPDDTLTGNDQYLIIDPTAPGHIHIRAGGTQDNSNADLFLGGENTYFKVNAGANSEARISANSHSWVFGQDAILTVPGEGVIRSIQDTVILQSYDLYGNTYSARLGTNGGLYFETTDYPSGWLSLTNDLGNANISSPSGNINITSELNVAGNVTANYFIGNGSQLTGLPASYSDANVVTFLAAYGSNNISTTGNITAGNFIGAGSNVELVAQSAQWIFDTTGNLTVAGNIVMPGGASLVGDGASPAPNINGFDSVSAVTFSASGNITTTATVSGKLLYATQSAPNEGGEIQLALPSSGTTLTGNIVIDSYQNQIRLFESTDSRGLYVDVPNVSVSGQYAIGYRDVPQLALSGNVTANSITAGKHFYSTTAGNLQITIPDNANVAFPLGATLTVVVNAAGNVIVAQGTGVSLYMAGSSTTGNRTVGAYGLASVMKVATDTWVISGTGVY